jgi:hypothetical protein
MSAMKWWSPIGDFATRTFVSSAIYIVIALPAIALFGLVALAERLGATTFLVRTFRLLEYVVVIVDAVFFLLYLVKDLRNFIRETWK